MICSKCKKEIGSAPVCPYCHTEQQNTPTHYLPAGTVIDEKYVVKSVLGEGGFGITYLAQDTLLERPVAVKEYFPHGFSYRDTTVSNTVTFGSGDREEVFTRGKERFLREARTAAKFSSEPGIVDIRDFVEENNTAYIIMEYLDGETLREFLRKRGRLEARYAFTLLTPIISSLEKIHAVGLIHRDISPDNIMVLKNGELKLMDFGAAKDVEADSQTTSIMLKKGYAPEEQYRRGGEQGPWTDVYALCATLYRCITGKTPDESLDRLIEDKLLRPSQLGIAITPALENVLMYGLAVRKEDRCPDMTALKKLTAQALRTAPDGRTPAVRPVQPPAQRYPSIRNDNKPAPYGAGMKIWVITMLLAAVSMLILVPVSYSDLSAPILWICVIIALTAFLSYAGFRVFRTEKKERSKRAFTAAVIFFSIFFIGVLTLLLLNIFMGDIFTAA